jgi:hypothetical protein
MKRLASLTAAAAAGTLLHQYSAVEAWLVGSTVRRTRASTTLTSSQHASFVHHQIRAAERQETSCTSTSTNANTALFLNPLPWEIEDETTDSKHTSLKTRVSERSSKMGSSSMATSAMAKLAAAFSPPEQAIDPAMINHVEVINVEGDKIEIQVTLCDGDSMGSGCVALFIPVSFPNSCLHMFYSEEEEMCILENLDRLHHSAEGKVTKQESTRASDSLEAFRSDLQLDQTRPPNFREISPSWWVAAEDANGQQTFMPSLKTMDLVEECGTIKTLLNCGDFDDELKGLAQDGMSGVKDGLSMDVERAVVADVSPSGFFMRARVIDPKNQRSIVELFWPFDGEACKDAQTLRSKVLGAVAAVSGGAV